VIFQQSGDLGMSERASDGAAEVLERSGGRRLPRTKGSKGVGRRKLVAGVGVLAVVGAGVGAVWAWQAFIAQGPQPAQALPASTLAYVAVDFDPAAGQKLTALGFLRKFPSIKEHVGLADASDLRKDVFDEVKSDLGCELSYDDVEPWIGQRLAFALVDQGGAQPVAVLQVADRDRAAAGLERLARCSDGDFGYALGDGWVVLAGSGKVADRVQRDAASAPLAEDAEFQRWTGEAGDPGVMTLYAAPEAGPAAVAAIEGDPYGAMYASSLMGFDPLSMLVNTAGFATMGMADYGGGDYATATEATPAPRKARAVRRPHKAMPSPITQAEMKKLENMTPAEQDNFFQKKFGEPVDRPGSASGDPLEGEVVDEEEFAEEIPQPDLPADLRAALMDFSGLGGVVRFDDGALELELVSDRIEGTMGNLVSGTAGDDVLAALPADSAAVFGAGFREGWGARFVERFVSSAMLFMSEPPADPAAEFEKDTGLTIADVEALGGDSFVLVAGSGLDPDAVFEDPTAMKVAARISGDADRVEAALTKLRANMPGASRDLLHWQRIGDDVVVGANAGYLAELASPGSLAAADSFTHAVPDAADAASVGFLNFDAGNWAVQTASRSDRPDTEPLAGLGYSLHDEGERERTVLRLTTED
jgi:hypothetical protein